MAQPSRFRYHPSRHDFDQARVFDEISTVLEVASEDFELDLCFLAGSKYAPLAWRDDFVDACGIAFFFALAGRFARSLPEVASAADTDAVFARWVADALDAPPQELFCAAAALGVEDERVEMPSPATPLDSVRAALFPLGRRLLWGLSVLNSETLSALSGSDWLTYRRFSTLLSAYVPSGTVDEMVAVLTAAAGENAPLRRVLETAFDACSDLDAATRTRYREALDAVPDRADEIRDGLEE